MELNVLNNFLILMVNIAEEDCIRYWRNKCTKVETGKIQATNCKLAALRIVTSWVYPLHYWGMDYHVKSLKQD